LTALLEAELVGQFVGLVERALAAAFEQGAGVVFEFFSAGFESVDNRGRLVLFAVRSAQFTEFVGLGLERWADHRFDHFFLLLFGRLIGVDVVFVGKVFGFLTEAFAALLADRVALLDVLGLGQHDHIGVGGAVAAAAAARRDDGNGHRAGEQRD